MLDLITIIEFNVFPARRVLNFVKIIAKELKSLSIETCADGAPKTTSDMRKSSLCSNLLRYQYWRTSKEEAEDATIDELLSRKLRKSAFKIAGSSGCDCCEGSLLIPPPILISKSSASCCSILLDPELSERSWSRISSEFTWSISLRRALWMTTRWFWK